MRGRNLVSRLTRRRGGGMEAFDRLPPDLRAWLHGAALPWSAASARRQWLRALAAARGDSAAACAVLSRIEARLLARDAARVWGRDHPAANPGPPCDHPLQWRRPDKRPLHLSSQGASLSATASGG